MKIGVIILGALALGSIAWRTWQRLRFFLHMSQLHGYKANEFGEWLFTRSRNLLVRPSHLVATIVVVFAWLFSGQSLTGVSIAILAVWTIIFASAADYLKPTTKKPIKFTPRLKRLTALSIIILGIVAAILFPYGSVLADKSVTRFALLLAAVDLLAPIAIPLGNVVVLPLERFIQNGFKRQARRKLASMPHLKIIAITGSYGKTSVKFAIAEILKQKFNVLATPGSFNTPMGICLVINRDLKPEHQVLVLEMGARYAGDIQELCDIAQPDIGVVTNVGIAHLETFGSRDVIAKEKGTIVENIKQHGYAVLNGDDDLVRNMSSRTNQEVVFAGLESTDSLLTVRDLTYHAGGAEFVLCDDDDHSVEVQTKLIGRHNILNILIGAVVGYKFGLRLRQIAHSIERMQPVDHRLKVRKQGEITIIDDAFNSNPVGARNAVEMLGLFKGGKRIIVTPGMIELGDREFDENKKFGAAIAANADTVVLVGQNQTTAIQEGLRDASYPDEQIHVFSSLSEAQSFLSTILSPGDIVLYENDLPDQFDEAA